MLSAGFDGGAGDEGNLRAGEVGLDLLPEDFAWLTAELMAVARLTAGGRVVSVLEGGYGNPPDDSARCVWTLLAPRANLTFLPTFCLMALTWADSAARSDYDRAPLAENATAHVAALCGLHWRGEGGGGGGVSVSSA